MKIIGHKKLDKSERYRSTPLEKLMLIGTALLFLLLGSTGFYIPLTYIIFNKEYSGMMIIAVLIVLAVGVPMTIYHKGRKIYIITAMIAYILGAFVTYWFIGNVYPGEEITGLSLCFPALLSAI